MLCLLALVVQVVSIFSSIPQRDMRDGTWRTPPHPRVPWLKCQDHFLLIGCIISPIAASKYMS